MRRILVVAASGPLAQSLSVMLVSHFDFAMRRTAREALACYEIEKPDLVLVDHQLPDRDGVWLVQALQRMGGPHIPAVVMAATAEQQALCAQAGIEAVLMKPFNAQQLLGLLETVSRLRPSLLGA